MPRRTSGTGNVLPMPPLDTEEVKFWLHIMEEHALFIKNGLPFDKTDLIEEASSFEREFKALRVRAEKLQNEKKFAEIITDTMASLKEFIRFKSLLLGMSMTNKLGSALPPLFFDHIIREAEYFMALLEKIRAGKKLAVVKAGEADFWLRIMADHTKFIGSRLDPSERSLRGVAERYEAEFDDLSLQSRDYVSIFEHKSMDLPAFNRFLQDSRAATMRLRDFQKATYDMIITNRMLSTIPATLADHVRREAEHFLLVLAMIEKGVIKVEKDGVDLKHCHNSKYSLAADEEAADCVDLADFAIDDECDERDYEDVAEAAVIDESALDFSPDKGREEFLPELDLAQEKNTPAADPGESKAKYQIKTEIIPAVEEVPAPQPKAAPKTEKKSKYKWGENWPRQLGKIKS